MVVAGDPGQLAGLAGGEILGVLPQRVAAVLQLLGVAGHVHAAQQIPHPAPHDVEGLAAPAHDVKRVETQRGVLAGGEGAVTDPLRGVGADELDPAGPFGAE